MLFFRAIWLILTSWGLIEDDRVQILFILQGDLADSDLVGPVEDDRLPDMIHSLGIQREGIVYIRSFIPVHLR